MNEEQISKRIEFIIEQQAQFATDLQSLREVQAADSAFMRESYHTLTGAVTTIVNLVGKLAEAQERTEKRVAELAEALARTDARLAQTDERLNIFIDVVEKYISRNGGNGSKGSG